MTLEFKLEDLTEYFSTTKQSEVFRNMHATIHFYGKVPGAFKVDSEEPLNIVEDFLLPYNSYLSSELPDGLHINLVDFKDPSGFIYSPEYEGMKSELLEKSTNVPLTKLKIAEIEKVSRMLQSFHVLSMFYVGAMTLPPDLKNCVHTDEIENDIPAKTEGYNSILKFLGRYSKANLPIKLNEGLKEQAGKLYDRFLELNTFYKGDGKALDTSSHDCAWSLSFVRANIFNVFGLQKIIKPSISQN